MIKRSTAYFFLLTSTICWGLAFVFVKPSLEYISPFRFLLYRYILAALLSTPLIWYYWKKIKHIWRAIKTIVLLELFGTTFCLSLLYSGLAHSTAITASIFTSTTPLFIVLAGVLFLKEKQEKHESVGLFIACIATLVLAVAPSIFTTQSAGIASLLSSGNILILGATSATALYFILAKKYYQKLPKLFVTAVSFFVGSVSFLLLVLYEQHFSTTSLLSQIHLDALQPTVWFAVGYMALFGSIIGGTAYLKGQAEIETSEASVFTYLQPLVAIPAGIILLQESVTPIQIGALVAIVVGVIIAEKRPTALRKS